MRLKSFKSTLLTMALLSPLLVSAADDLLGPAATREGAEALVWSAKTTCGTTEEAVPRYGTWEGRLYSRSPGEKDRHIFDVIGINTRQCERHTDAVRGEGFRSISREIMVYLDPATGEIIDQWKNPWTGETVEVVHVANDPVNMRQPIYTITAAGKPLITSLRWYDDLLVSSSEAPLFYDNPLAGGYQEYIGGNYHAMEIFNTYYRTVDFINNKKPRIGDSRISWQRISSWLPWMRMGDRSGEMIFNATGYSTFDQKRISPRLMKIIASRYPQYINPPPLGDSRPNATTWTVTKIWIDKKRAAQGGK
ncbi:MAG: DUF1838 domain-containing protein [Gammaproteobacteria bacterium]|nr:DUF1838 domain-containing protein [Gammaproteobacteria bacterium]